MAQTDLLLPWLPVIDNVLLGYRLRGDTNGPWRPPGRAPSTCWSRSDWARRLGGPSPQVLSGGMRQRALARTLCEDRAIVLMDDPFAHLDAVTRLAAAMGPAILRFDKVGKAFRRFEHKPFLLRNILLRLTGRATPPKEFLAAARRSASRSARARRWA